MIRSKIAGFEKELPPFVVTNNDLAELVDTSDEWISSRTGIKQRNITTKQNTSDLCIACGKRLLEKTATSPEQIDMIVVGTVTPDFATPSTACMVQEALGCVNAICFDISAACSGFIYSLSAADKFIKCGSVKKALIFGAETLSKLVDWTDRSTCVLFADGAGGVLLEATDSGGILLEDIHSDGSKGRALTAGYRENKNPYFKGEEYKGKSIDMNGRDIFGFATRKVPESIRRVLDEAGLETEEIDYFVLHQANIRINEVIARKLKVSSDKFYSNIYSTGNTSGASIPIVLAEMSEKGLLKPGDRLIISGFGGGLTWGTMLIEL